MQHKPSISTRNALVSSRAQALTNFASLLVAYRYLDELVKATDLELAFDPVSEPDLLDLLGVTALVAGEASLVGAGIGLFAGVLLGNPARGLAIGASIGGVAGAGRGVAAVRRGTRLRARRLATRPAQLALGEEK